MLPGSWHRSRRPGAGAARAELAAAFRADLRTRRPDPRDPQDARRRCPGSRDEPTGLCAVGPVIAAAVSAPSTVSRFPGRYHFAAYNGTAPIEVSSGPRKIYRLTGAGTGGSTTPSNGRGYPARPWAQPGPGLLRQETGRGQNPERGPARAETADQQCHFAYLQADPGARPPPPRAREGSRGTTLFQRGRLTPRHRLRSATPGPGHPSTSASGSPHPGLPRRQSAPGRLAIPRSLPPRRRRSRGPGERPQRSEDARP